jgi:hypothetical protein
MRRRLPVPLVPGPRGGYLLDADLPPLSREEIDRILALVGSSSPDPYAGTGSTETCDPCRECEDEPVYIGCPSGASGASL